ncbi:MAG: NAD(P)-binding domain-containing protein, partial [Dehalococcoidia bacterium]|nr:NAD(P)-binding domain-containing protein [Dehalococcoidia bacterium]
MRLAFIGGGVMARAIIAGVKDAGIDADIIVGEPLEIQRETLHNDLKVETTPNNKDAVSGADIVVISIKP